MPNPFALDANQGAPGVFCFAVTPSDSVNFTIAARALYIGTAGDVVVVNPNGTTCTFVGVPAGSILPVSAIRVNATSTTASNIVGIA